MDQNFSWLEYIGHELEQQGPRRQRAGNLRNAVRKYALKLNAGDFTSRSKGQSKTTKSASSSTRTILNGARTWTDLEPQKYSLSDCPVSKKLINLLRHGSLLRDNDGAIEFWRIKRLSSGSFCVLSSLV